MKTFLPVTLYNYYPQTAISLCVTSYLDIAQIPSQVKAMGLDVVWGPARKLSLFDVPYSLAFIARNATTNEHWVVVRGTDPISLTAWITEDFSVGATVPFNLYAPHAPEAARVSKGTADGLNDLLSLPDPNTGEHMREFLLKQDMSYVYVTGHSLGGTLTPPTFAAISNALHGDKAPENMAMWSFAGLTSGNQEFADYIDVLTQNGSPENTFAWRFRNPLDIAPLLFENLDQVKNIYDRAGIQFKSMDFILRGLLEDLFDRSKGKGYAQPNGEMLLCREFSEIDDTWVKQALHQHHGPTYQHLVYKEFPVNFPLGS